ncbi:hypothetical protein THAOC_29391, partial [Thalassiosira oceanica]
MRDEICARLSSSEALLVVAETGSGKSTQIPAYIHGSGMLTASSREAGAGAPSAGAAGGRHGR